VLAVRPAAARLVGWARDREDRLHVVLPVLVGGAIGAGAAAEWAGLHPVLGGFLFGLVMPRDVAVLERIGGQLRGFTVVVLLPLFFAGVGMITSVGALTATPGVWMAFGVLVLTAAVTKFVGAGVASRLAGMGRRDSVRLGVLLNCRGITEIVVATIGFEAGLINQAGLTVLVLTALVTTAMTVPLMRATADPAASMLPDRPPPARPPAASTSTR
jgi:Kef-type K+ transport system membrane component KefB